MIGKKKSVWKKTQKDRRFMLFKKQIVIFSNKCCFFLKQNGNFSSMLFKNKHEFQHKTHVSNKCIKTNCLFLQKRTFPVNAF